MRGKAAFVLLFLFGMIWEFGCQKGPSLPILGPYEREDGQKKFHPVRPFRLLNQDSTIVTENSFQDRLRVVDFFFLSCPSICPQVQAQMLRIRAAFPDEDRLTLVSHTIDPKRDTVAALAHYAHNLGVTSAERWQFLTGDRDLLFQLADDHFNIVVEDASAPGGFDHTGRIVLIDQAGYIRSFGNGMNPPSIDTLIVDIRQLLQE